MLLNIPCIGKDWLANVWNNGYASFPNFLYNKLFRFDFRLKVVSDGFNVINNRISVEFFFIVMFFSSKCSFEVFSASWNTLCLRDTGSRIGSLSLPVRKVRMKRKLWAEMFESFCCLLICSMRHSLFHNLLWPVRGYDCEIVRKTRDENEVFHNHTLTLLGCDITFPAVPHVVDGSMPPYGWDRGSAASSAPIATLSSLLHETGSFCDEDAVFEWSAFAFENDETKPLNQMLEHPSEHQVLLRPRFSNSEGVAFLYCKYDSDLT